MSVGITQARELATSEAEALLAARPRLLELRAAIRAVLATASDGLDPPPQAIDQLNRTSRAAPAWLELDPHTRRPRSASHADTAGQLLADFARAAILLVTDDASQRLNRCPAPSCGMYYRRGRSDQRWCSPQCGARARVARHYRSRHQR